uniref:Uncharacterized protein n=1 Tax=Candidatus Kentrum sp. TC TaxID=2126339 RepID=A0A450YV96_9GAMM|nr:MAG: hypothetical protein BECKTC1821E_GA0114239_10498 [Candidatus Kentron sp. TC]
MTVFSDDEWRLTQRSVELQKYIVQQRLALPRTFQEVVYKLDEAEMKHRQQFQDEKLSDCFP